MRADTPTGTSKPHHRAHNLQKAIRHFSICNAATRVISFVSPTCTYTCKTDCQNSPRVCISESNVTQYATPHSTDTQNTDSCGQIPRQAPQSPTTEHITPRCPQIPSMSVSMNLPHTPDYHTIAHFHPLQTIFHSHKSVMPYSL